jgi:hypothetical protein
MKTKIIGLAAITLALVMSVGMVSADHGVSTTIDVGDGYAFQAINYDLFLGDTLDNYAIIGNFGVIADCGYPFMETPLDVWDAVLSEDYVVYNEVAKGTGYITTTLGLVTEPDCQKATKLFTQSGAGHKVAVLEYGNVDINTQDLFFATDGYLDNYTESKLVTIRTCTDDVLQVVIAQEVNMSSMDPASQTSMLFHELDAPALNDLYMYQYLAAPDVSWDLNLGYTIP